MLVEPYLKARYFQGRAKGKAEGLAEGRAEGAADERRKWRGWLERRATAEREGRPFDEPPPDALTGKGGK